MTPATLRLIYIILQFISTIILIGELIYIVFQKPSTLKTHFLMLVVMTAFASIGYTMELMGDNFLSAYFGICLGYISKPIALIASLMILLEYSNIKVKPIFPIILSLIFLGLTLIVITNPVHQLYYDPIVYDPNKFGSPLSIIKHGLFWYVYMVLSFLIFIGYSIVVFYEYKNCKTKTAKQMAILLFLVVMFSFVGLGIFIAGISFNYDTTLTGMMLGSIVMIFLFTKYRMFDSLTEAQRKSLDESKDGIVVLDARMCVSFYNKTAHEILPELKSNIGRKKEMEIIEEIEKINADEPLLCNNHVYKLSVVDEMSKKNDFIVGRTYTFKEITEHYYYSKTLSEEIASATTKIRSIQRSVLGSFANLVEARDGTTGEHIKNVAETCRLLANSLRNIPDFANEIDDNFVNILVECAPLHDVGKIYIPDAILLKPGKLTEEEREIMKTHAAKGAEIIDSTIKEVEEPEYSKIAKEITLCHHEWWDGSGYPNGLKGDKIPLSARILAVADVYDALRKERPYKKAYTKEESIKIIQEECCRHFDSRIVGALIRIADKLN